MSRDVLLVGKSDCIAASLRKSDRLGNLYVLNETASPGLRQKAQRVIICDTTDARAVAKWAEELHPDFAIIGSEEPLAAGVVDALEAVGVPCIGPRQKLAKLESSKAFTRELLSKYNIPGNPEYRIFRSADGLPEYLRSLGEFVIKPDGLTAGKGVQVFGDHFSTIEDGLAYCHELFDRGQRAVIIEEKLDGEEFSYQSFWDGRHAAHTIPVQDHKRAFENDTGPNTGGMGSYSCADHLLPFLSATDVAAAAKINQLVGEALLTETGEEYKGILYGGFMLTKRGLRVIEYNARFGDPEVMNVLSLLETDFVEICEAIIDGSLDKTVVKFSKLASVCKYLVPEGYPKTSAQFAGTKIDLSSAMALPNLGSNLRMYYAAVNEKDGAVTLTNSRSVAFVGIANALDGAENFAEGAASLVRGHVFHRHDIGTAALIRKRVEHMQRICAPEGPVRRFG